MEIDLIKEKLMEIIIIMTIITMKEKKKKKKVFIIVRPSIMTSTVFQIPTQTQPKLINKLDF